MHVCKRVEPNGMREARCACGVWCCADVSPSLAAVRALHARHFSSSRDGESSVACRDTCVHAASRRARPATRLYAALRGARDPAARSDRVACAVPCQCRCALVLSSRDVDLAQRVLFSHTVSARPVPGAANTFVQRTFTSRVVCQSRTHLLESACATLAVGCVRLRCVPRGVMEMVGYMGVRSFGEYLDRSFLGALL